MTSIESLPINNILFLDIETVSKYQNYEDMDKIESKLWEEKIKYRLNDSITAKGLYESAGIWAEFGKIICISVGYLSFKNTTRRFRMMSFSGKEKEILEQFNTLLNNHFNKPQHLLCAHNGKEFDFPYIARRCIINGVPLPQKLNLFGKKPWEIPHLDTMELWRFGDYKAYTSLSLLTNILGIPSPKDDIDGSMVGNIFYKENDIERIISYCEKDTVAVAQVFLRFLNNPILKEQEIVKV